MRLAHTILVLALTLGLSPGLLELVQDGAHLLVDGHTDHAEDAEACSEHGCAPTGHHCDCCATMQVVKPSVTASIPDCAVTDQRWLPRAPDPAPPGVQRRLLRPPAA